MFSPAAPIRKSLAMKKPLPRYLVALEMNRRPPEATATTSAHQVSGKIPWVTRLTERRIEASPSNLRSTARMEPTTRQIASTCTDSIKGNSRSFSRILSARRLFSRYEIRSASCGIILPRIGDPAPGEEDAAPDQHGGGRDNPPGDPPPPIPLPEIRSRR